MAILIRNYCYLGKHMCAGFRPVEIAIRYSILIGFLLRIGFAIGLHQPLGSTTPSSKGKITYVKNVTLSREPLLRLRTLFEA